MKVSKINNVDQWRKAVRIVARRHGWKVRTGVSHGTAWAIDIRDQPEAVRRELASTAIANLDATMAEARKPKLRQV